jgi:IS5 family transposase
MTGCRSDVFSNFCLEDAAPDHTTICRFRNRVVEAQLTEKLFGEFERQLEGRGLLLKRGTMIDPTLVETPHRGGPPLRDSEKRHNTLVAAVRASIEGVIAALKPWMGFDRVRYVGLVNNNAHLHPSHWPTTCAAHSNLMRNEVCPKASEITDRTGNSAPEAVAPNRDITFQSPISQRSPKGGGEHTECAA